MSGEGSCPGGNYPCEGVVRGEGVTIRGELLGGNLQRTSTFIYASLGTKVRLSFQINFQQQNLMFKGIFSSKFFNYYFTGSYNICKKTH